MSLPVRGGILADEMGMGKTVETLALIAFSKHQLISESQPAGYAPSKRARPLHKASTLIVCPMVLLSQWRDEVLSHTHLSVLIYYGAEKTRSASDLQSYDVVITSYGTLSAERAADSSKDGLLLSTQWFRVVLDEVVSELYHNDIDVSSVVIHELFFYRHTTFATGLLKHSRYYFMINIP